MNDFIEAVADMRAAQKQLAEVRSQPELERRPLLLYCRNCETRVDRILKRLQEDQAKGQGALL